MRVVDSNDLFQTAALSLDLGQEELGTHLLCHLVEQLPTHLAAHCLLGNRYLAVGREADAAVHFEAALSVDPLYLAAVKGIAQAQSMTAVPPTENRLLRRLVALYPWDSRGQELAASEPQGLSTLAVARILTRCEHHEEAVAYYRAVREDAREDRGEKTVLELLLAQALWAAQNNEESRPLLEYAAREHPSWARPKLLLADIAMRERQDAVAVALLHDARALDSSGAVGRELLEEGSLLGSLVRQGFSVPAPPDELMQGAPELFDRLLSGTAVPAPERKSLVATKSVVMEPEQAPLRESVNGNGRIGNDQSEAVIVPLDISGEDAKVELDPARDETGVRLVVSCREKITARYGEEAYRKLDTGLSALCEATARSTGDETIKLYLDDATCMEGFGLEAMDSGDADDLANALRDVESRLCSKNKDVRSLLIIGGDKIVPFHRLPNPADDDDPEILSDWPYAAAVDNPLAPRFAVGRLPDSEPADMDAFAGILEHAIAHHDAVIASAGTRSSSFWRRPLRKVFGACNHHVSSLCYTAEIWAEASRSVFGLIGDGSKVEVSPPVTDYDFLTVYDQIPTLSYFNLHGFRGTPYWYGHGESEDGAALVPVALTPLSLSWTKAAGTLVYSEACYGADLERVYPEGSIPVNFLRGGALGFIGSTSMSYGALEPPLSGADLLGAHLWEGITGGFTIGEALRRARSAFVQSAASQQGYLDGEDQKALLSFVLYGDPSLILPSADRARDLEPEIAVSFPPLACCSRVMDAEALPLPKEVRQKVQRSLPFVQADGLTAHPLILCRVAGSNGGCGTRSCGGEQESTGKLSELLQASQQQVVSKGGDQLRHVVKVTVNADGDVLKVLVSRGGLRVLERGE